MRLRTFLIINACLFIPFGIGMLTVPSFIFPMLKVHLDDDGLMMARTVGSMLLSFGLICFYARNETLHSIGMKAVIIGNLSFHTIDFLITGKSAITGVMNSFGFMFSLMHFLFAIGFIYFLNKTIKNDNRKRNNR